MKIVNDNNVDASVKVCVVTIKNEKKHTEKAKQTVETLAMERLKHFWISKWKPDSLETNRKPAGPAKHQFLSKTTSVFHQLQQSSQPVSRRTVGLLSVCTPSMTVFPRANCSCTATCRLGSRPHYKHLHRLTGSALREVAWQRRPCQPRGGGSTIPLFSLPFLLMEGRRCSH